MGITTAKELRINRIIIYMIIDRAPDFKSSYSPINVGRISCREVIVTSENSRSDNICHCLPPDRT